MKPGSGMITVEGPVDVALTSGMPDEERVQRVKVYLSIYKITTVFQQRGKSCRSDNDMIERVQFLLHF